MIPTEVKEPRLAVHRNRDGFLLGASWSHHSSWERRLTHFYLGWWVLTLRTAGHARSAR